MKYLLNGHLKKLEENLSIDLQNYEQLNQQLMVLKEAIIAKRGAVDILKILLQEMRDKESEKD